MVAEEVRKSQALAQEVEAKLVERMEALSSPGPGEQALQRRVFELEAELQQVRTGGELCTWQERPRRAPSGSRP